MNQANVTKALLDEAAEMARRAGAREDLSVHLEGAADREHERRIAATLRERQGALLSAVNHVNGVSPE